MGVGEPLQRHYESLLALDPAFEVFVSRHAVKLARNEKESVGRSLRWGANPHGLIQLFLSDLAQDEWKLWLCCFQDRGDERFWKTRYLVDGKPLNAFSDRLPQLLENGFALVDDWRRHPDHLEFATKIAQP